MSAGTSIEWTDRTWNPVRGCSRVSEGCRNCYAERQAARFSDRGQYAHGFVERTTNGPRWTGRVELVLERIAEPLSWRPLHEQRVFVNSMSDLFHESLPFEQVAAVFAVMHARPCTTFQVLTKRPARMREFVAWLAARGGIGRYIRSDEGREAVRRYFDRVARFQSDDGGRRQHRSAGDPWMVVFNAAAVTTSGPQHNVWLGVSVEDQETADERIPILLDTPAAVRFVSAEPLLGAVDLSRFMWPVHAQWPSKYRSPEEASAAGATVTMHRQALVLAGSAFIDWVIVGGESGPGARPCKLAWIRSVGRQCRDAEVPLFVKQAGSLALGSGLPEGDETGGDFRWFTRSRKGGALSDLPEDLRVRQFPREREAVLS